MLDLNNSLGVEDKPYVEKQYTATTEPVLKVNQKSNVKNASAAPKKEVETNPNQPIKDKDMKKSDIGVAPIIDKSSQKEQAKKGEKSAVEKNSSEIKDIQTSYKWALILGLVGGVGGYFLAKYKSYNLIQSSLIGLVSGGIVGLGIDKVSGNNELAKSKDVVSGSIVNLGQKTLNKSVDETIRMMEMFTNDSKPEQVKQLSDSKIVAEQVKSDPLVIKIYNDYVAKLSADEQNALSQFLDIEKPKFNILKKADNDYNKKYYEDTEQVVDSAVAQIKLKYPKVDTAKIKTIVSSQVPELQKALEPLMKSLKTKK